MPSIRQDPGDFVIGEDDFADLQINPALIGGLYWFYGKAERRQIKQFVLIVRKNVNYVCRVTLVAKGDKFTPRLEFSVRDNRGRISRALAAREQAEPSPRARVDLGDCHESFWKLISFLQLFRQIEIPRESFSVIGEESELLRAISQFGGTKGRADVIEAIELLADKTPLEISELMKAVFSESGIRAKEAKLAELKQLVEKTGVGELEIQRKLSEMPWVFGPEYERLDVRTAGASGIPDRRLKRIDGLSDLLEIKLPSAELLRTDERGRRYISPALSEALGQLMGYLEYFNSSYQTVFEDDTREERLEDLYGSYYKPKGILLIGRRIAPKSRTGSNAEPKRLRRLLSYFHWIDVLTYDDLIERAQSLLTKMAAK